MTTSTNVASGKPLATGGILIAPLGTVMPIDLSTALNASFAKAGYIAEDGVTEAFERTTEKVKAWGGKTVKVMQSEHSLIFSFTFIESFNAVVLKSIYGDENVTVTAATATTGAVYKVLVTDEDLPHNAYVFEIKDGDARIRIAGADGLIMSVGEITYVDAELISYPVTVEFFDDENGVKAIKYLSDGVFSGTV